MRRTLPWLALLLTSLVQAQEGPPHGWVVLSLDEYRALRSKADPPELPLPRPPVDAAVTRADYELRLDGASAVGEARLQIDVFTEGYVAVAVPDGLLVGGARLDGRPVALVELPSAAGPGPVVPGAGRRQVVLSKTGPQQLVLDVVLPVATQAGSELLALPPAPGVISRLALSLPRAGVEPSVGDGLLVESAEAAGQTRLVAATRPGGTLTLSWRRRREDQRAALPLRYRGSVTALVGLGEDVAQVQAEVRVSVLQGQAGQLNVALPPGLLVNDVSGALVADWQARDGRLEVRLLEPLEGEGAFTLVAEQRVAREGRLGVPLLRLPEAERETGGVAVEVAGAGEIDAPAQRGLDDTDPSELGGPVSGRDSPSLVAFRYRPQAGQAARSLEVEVKRYTPEEVQVATVSEARHRVLLSEQGRRLVQSRWAVRNNQERFLAVTLPPGATLWSAAVAGRPVRPGQDPQGQLLLPLPKGRPGDAAPTSSVEVVYVESGPALSPPGRVAFRLPAASLPVQRTGVELRLPPGFTLTPEPGGLRAAAYALPAEGVLLHDGLAPEPPRPAAPPKPAAAEKKEAQVQELVGKLKDGRGARRAGTLPLRVPFPAVGPMLYLAEDLTPEGSLPAVELRCERSKGKE